MPSSRELLEETDHDISSYDEQYMTELRKLLGVQYYFLSRVHSRTGDLPERNLDPDSAEVEQLLSQVFTNPLSVEERDGAICSLEIFFQALQELCEGAEEFPRFDDVWERYEAMILEASGEELDEELPDEDVEDEEFVDEDLAS